MTKDTLKYVIFDTDMGTDDAWALQMILKAEKYLKNIKVMAITCVNGNTSMNNVIKNAYRMLDGVDRTDIPIHKGAIEPLLPVPIHCEYFHGENGFGDIDFWSDKYPTNLNKIINPKNAVQTIRDLIMEHPGKITLICLGPLTNVALAVKTYSEIKDNVEEILIMGGNMKGVGNVTSCAEFNFYMDPEAAHIVLDSFNCPITVVPWECCIGDSVSISKEWRFKVLGSTSDCRNVELLNAAESVAYENYEIFMPCDAYAVAVFLFPECIRKKQKCHATVELHGNHTRGQMIIDHLKRNNQNVTLIELLHEDECKKALQFAATS